MKASKNHKMNNHYNETSISYCTVCNSSLADLLSMLC